MNPLRRLIRHIVLALHILTGIRIEVKGRSMEPACRQGTKLWASRLSYLTATPSRLDMIVVRLPGDPGRLAIKRIVALPGEKVEWKPQGLWVNEEHVDESYARNASPPPGDDSEKRWQLGPDEYFVLGDNRLYSKDSRDYGPLRRSNIVGKVLESGVHAQFEASSKPN